MLNSIYRPLVDGGYILAASAASNLAVQKAVELSITDTRLWLGLSVPHWVGWVAFIAALFFGATISLHQETAVDKYIKRPRLKPYYSFGFGFFVAAFGIPIKYPNLTVFDLVIPALLLSAVGSQVIYYLVAFSSSPELWSELKERGILIVKGGKSS